MKRSSAIRGIVATDCYVFHPSMPIMFASILNKYRVPLDRIDPDIASKLNQVKWGQEPPRSLTKRLTCLAMTEYDWAHYIDMLVLIRRHGRRFSRAFIRLSLLRREF